MALQRESNGNARRRFLHAHGAKHASRATVAAMYAAAQAASVDARNAEVVVTLGGEESSSASSDSESSMSSGASSEPYGEPSPPKSIPKPLGGFQFGHDVMGFSNGSSQAEGVTLLPTPRKPRVVVHEEEEEVRASLTSATTDRFRFSPATSRVSFSSSLCPTEGTSSLNSSFSSMLIGASAASPADGGRLSVAHLSSSSASLSEGASGESSSLPPKLVFTVKTVPDEASVHTKQGPESGPKSTAPASVRALPSVQASGFCPSASTSRLPTTPSFAPHSGVFRPSASTSGRPTTPSFAGPSMFSFSSSQAFSRPIVRSVDRAPSMSTSGVTSDRARPTFFTVGGSEAHPAAATTSVGRVTREAKGSTISTSAITSSFARSTVMDTASCTSVSSAYKGARSSYASAGSNPSVLSTSMANVKDSAMTAQATEGETDCSCATACSPSSKNVRSKGPKHVRFSFECGPNQTPRDDIQGTMEQSVTPTQETKVKASSSTNGITSSRSILSGSPTQAITYSNQDDPINSSWSSASLSTGSRLCGAPFNVEVPEGRGSYEFVFSGDSATSSAPKVSRFPAFSAYTGLNSITLEINDASRVARGKSGVIYQAKSGVSKLAVKVVSRPISKSANARFERELVQLQNLPEHPCVVRHHGYMALGDAKKIGVITDLVIGSETWHARLHNTILSLNEESKHLILLQILDAVAFLHSHDVTHRDLSLHHVLHVYGSSSEVIKLIDFGLPTLRAATTSSGSRSAARDWVDDHPHYASPEVLRGELSAHDNDGWKKSDIFSFAVLMAELLIEELPWDGESAKYVIKAVSQRGERAFQVGDVRLFGRKSPELVAIIERAWHKDPATRPNAEDLRKSLGALFSRPQNSDFNEPAQGSPQYVSREEVVGESKAGTATFYCPHFQFGFALPQESRAAFCASLKPQSPPISSLDAPAFGVSSPGAHPATPSVVKPASSFSSFTSATQPEFGSQSLPKSSSFFDLFSGSSSSKPDLSSLMLTISDKTRVAEGNRGATYRGTCHTREVAVKVVSKPKTHSACSRLDKEIRALKELPDHPNLVRYHGSIPIGDGRQMGFVTDFVFAGVAIDTRLHRTPHWLKEEDKHRMLIQVIDAVAFLHAHGITHRDLSWKHVLKTYESTSVIKLVDFGLPTLRSTTGGNPTSCASFAMMGFTLEYASPEALRGELSNREDEDWELSNGGWPEKKDCPRGGKPGWRESDVYSFATLMVEMLLEERPWEAESPMHVINAVAKQGRRPFKVERVRLFGEKSPTLEALIHEAWHENPLKRPSALELKTRLERLFRSD